MSVGPVTVRLSSRIHSPFAWSPMGRRAQATILIPRRFVRQMEGQQIADIVAHECAHLARRDDEMGLILRGLLCLAWLSPFAHRLFARWGQATEIRCDMAVTAGRSPQMRRAYADTLLQALHIVAGRVRQYPAASFSTHRLRTEKMRITHIVNGTRPSFKRRRDRAWLGVSAILLTLMGTAGVAAACSNSDNAKSSVANAIVTGKLTALYGQQFDPFKTGTPRTHVGVDIAAPFGTPIYAPADGIIRAATDVYDGKPAYGNVVILETEDGVMTMFAHLQGYTVAEGQRVTQGEQIATVGSSGKSTGPHVHIETRKDGARIDPMSVWDLDQT